MNAKITERLIATLKPGKKYYEVNDTDLKGFALRVQPSGVMTYYARYRLTSGTSKRVKIGPADALTVQQARESARDQLAAVTKGIDPAEARKIVRASALTLGSFVKEQFYPLHLSSKRSGDAIRDTLESKAFAELWSLPLGDITAGRVEKWRAALRADEKKPSSINRYLDTLKSVLARAMEWGVISDNPLAKMKRFKQDKKPKVRFLSHEEENRLLLALDEREEEMRAERDSANKWRRDRGYAELVDLRATEFVDHLKPLVLLSLHTGMRRGELFSLERADVDLQRAIVTVKGDTAKSGTTRHIDLNSVALDVLRRWVKQVPASGYVFPSPNGGRLDNVKHAWEGLLTRAKIDDFRWHDMRHDFASKLVMAGEDLNTVRELLGHSDIEMTLRYAHLAPKKRAAAVEKLVRGKGQIVPFRNAKGKRV